MTLEQKYFETVHYDRIFNDEKLDPFFELGPQPPANTLRDELNAEIFSAPLTLAWSEKSKSVQLTVNVDSKYLFRNYVWVTGTSKTANEYAHTFCERILERSSNKKPMIVEIASNDGTFLKPFIANGLHAIGVDPAQNIAEEARKNGVETIAEFFNEDIARQIVSKYSQSDVVFARNVIPHVEHIHDILKGVVALLKEDGLGAFEFHYAGKILEELHYDSIYHEHLFYFSLASMMSLLNKYNLHAYDMTTSPISGGSYVLYFSKTKREVSKALLLALAHEEKSEINKKSTWVRFAEQSIEHAKALKTAITEELRLGRKVIGYGASARSSTMLNFAGINSEHLLCIADKSHYKHNKYTAGTNIKIVSPESALAEKPDTILLLAWNFENEIIEELKNLHGFKGRVIVPLPAPVRILDI